MQFPSVHPPKYLLSIKSKQSFTAGCHFYTAITWKAKIKKLLLQRSYPILVMGSRVGLFADRDVDLKRLRNFIAQYCLNGSTWNLYVPSHGKAIVQIINLAGLGDRIVKICDSKGKNALFRERDNLTSIKSKNFETFEVPKVLHSGSGDHIFFVEYSCPQSYRPFEVTRTSLSMANLLVELFADGKKPDVRISESPTLGDITSQIMATENHTIKACCNRIIDEWIERFGNIRIPLGRVHSDFKPWNILINSHTKKLFIVDWEGMKNDGFPLWDAYSFVLFTYFTLHYDVRPMQVMRYFNRHKPFFDAYVNKLGIDFPMVKIMLPLYLIDIITRDDLWKRWDIREKRPSKILSSFVRYLEYVSENIFQPV